MCNSGNRAWVAFYEPQLNYQAVAAPGGVVSVPQLGAWTMVVASGGER